MADISLQITGNNAPLLTALAEARAAVTGATESMKSSFESVGSTFEKINKVFVAFTAVLAGGKVFKEAIDASVNLTKESVALGRQFGISATEASDLKVALASVFVTQDQLAAAGNAVTRSLRSHEDAFKSLGVATRDQNGEYRNTLDIILDVNEKLAALKQGTDRNVEGQRIYGKAWAEVAPTIKLTAETMEEAKKRAEALGLEVGSKDVAATKAYRTAMNEVHETIEGVWKVIGDALLPILTAMGQWFGDIGPQVVATFRQAVGTLQLAFEGLNAAANFIFELFRGGFQQLASLAVTVATVIGRAFVLDFHGAKDAWNKGLADLNAIGKQTYDRMEADAKASSTRIRKIWSIDFLQQKDPENKEIPRPTGGGSAPTADPKNSRIPEFKLELEQRKASFAEENAAHGQFLEFSKEAELSYWSGIAQRVDLSKNERIGVEMEVARLRVEIAKDGFDAQLAQLKEEEAAFKNNLDAKLAIAKEYAARIGAAYGSDSKEYATAAKEVVSIEREKASQLQQIEQQRLKITEEMQLGAVDREEEQAKLGVSLGIQTNAKLLAQERDFENRRYQIKLQALQQELALAARSPDKNPVEVAKINAQIEQLALQHGKRMNQIANQSTVEQSKYWTGIFSSMNSGFSGVIKNFLNGTASLKTTIQGLFSSIVDSVTQALAQMAADWLTNQIAQMLIGKTTAASQISANAAVAATAAMASVAAIPFIGWAMAPGVGASTFAIAESYNAGLAAEQGYSVPSGINPVVQLHQREMVLPAPEANAVRRMASGDDNSNSGRAGIVHIHGKKGDVFTSDQLAAMLRQLGHRFKLG